MRLKELRVAKGLYQKDIADMLGVDRTTYTKYESGASEPDVATLIQLADFFGVTVDYLINHKEVPYTMYFSVSDREKEIDTIGHRIRNVRKKNNLSLDDLAEKLRISPVQLFCYERDMMDPDKPTIERIADILHEPRENLFGGWSDGFSDDFDERLKKQPDRFTDAYIMEVFKQDGVPYDRHSLYLSIKSSLSGLDSKDEYADFIFAAITDKFGKPSSDLLQLYTTLEPQHQSPAYNTFSKYLKLDTRDQGNVDGRISDLLESDKYSLKKESKLA